VFTITKTANHIRKICSSWWTMCRSILEIRLFWWTNKEWAS